MVDVGFIVDTKQTSSVELQPQIRKKPKAYSFRTAENHKERQLKKKKKIIKQPKWNNQKSTSESLRTKLSLT